MTGQRSCNNVHTREESLMYNYYMAYMSVDWSNVRSHFRGGAAFSESCLLTREPDDVTIGFIVG